MGEFMNYKRSNAISKVGASFGLIIIILLIPTLFQAQNLLNNPESVVYDSIYKRYLVSNCGDGNIIQIDSSGQQDYFNTELTYTLGLHIVGDTLFVSSNEGIYSGIVGFLLSTGEIIFHVDIPEKQLLNDITSDLSGNLYVTDCDADKIYKVSISEKTYTTFIDSGVGYPNGILYDFTQNRLLVLNCLLPKRPLISINIDDASISTIVETGLNSIDGLTSDNNGFFYFSSWETDNIYRYDPSFIYPAEIVSSGHTDPADIFFNKNSGVLVIPNFNSNSIDYLEIPEEYLYPKFESDIGTGHAPLQVEFSQNTLTNQNIISWSWDFNNDGIIDSGEENPSYLFEEPGKYTVSLKVTTDFEEETLIKPELISVFDGKSALQFDGTSSNVTFPSKENLNLTEQFTIEAVLKPLYWRTTSSKQVILDKSAIKIFLVGKAPGAANDSTFGVYLKLKDESLVKVAAEPNSLSLDKWQHIALSYNSSISEIKMYVNGLAMETSIEGPNNPVGSLQTNDTISLVLGNDRELSTGYKGIIDELRVWGDVRTETEISDNLTNSLSGNEDNLLGYWKMDEGNGSEIVDLSESENTGFIESAVYVEGVDLSILTTINNDQEEGIIPSKLHLYQNYPNPFNPSTTIEFSIPRGGKIGLKLYDILGKEITTLIDEYKEAGSYNVSFDASKIKSGIYFYTLTLEKWSQTKKMILLK